MAVYNPYRVIGIGGVGCSDIYWDRFRINRY